MVAVGLLLVLFTSAYGAFRELPSNETVLLGSDIVFRCTAEKSTTGYELYSQWRSSSGTLLGFHDAGQLTGHQGRYSYVKDSPDELHLKIERVALEDDGQFECQMLRPEEGPSRASAFLNVLVPPKEIYFANYQAGSSVEVNEDTPLNVTCVVPNAKPAATITWYINGLRIEDGVNTWTSYNVNKTATAFSSLYWTPRRQDHKKILTCQATHQESSTQIRTNLTLNVLYPPDQPKVSVFGGDSFVRAGDNVTLVCVVGGGNPPPAVIWYLRERPIGNNYYFDVETQETRNTYSFLADPTDNLANYQCRARNRENAQPISREIHVKVAYAPQGVEIYGDVSIRMGEITAVQCRSKPSNPPAKISWLVNGHPLPSTIQSEHQQTHGTVSISNLTVNSNELLNGKNRVAVECTARNDEGSTSKQHVIKILAPPMTPRISGVEDGVHLEGDVVNMTCEAHGGNPLAELIWFRGYDKISGARSFVSGDSAISTISITLDRTLNNQRIKCEAMNAALDEPLVDTKQFSVLFPPRRVTIRAPEGIRHQLFAGKEARLLCSAPSSNPPATITWQFYPNGEPSPLVYTGETVLNETSRDNGYTIENAVTFVPTEAHDGTIARCIASSPLWPSSRNSTFPLNVYYAPRLLIDSPIGIVVSEGDSFRENLTVKANPPVSAWRWRKNGAQFDHTVGNVFARGATLSGRIIKSSDSGSYTLFATNSVGTANVTIQLNVEYAARITSISSPIIATSGETVVLECEAEGEPRKPEMVQWWRDGRKLTSTHQGDTRAVLRVNASEENAGQFVCRAENGIGQPAESTAYLLVNSAPKLLKRPSLSRAAGPLGGRARARCRAVAVPDVDFVWDRAGHLIQANSSKYSFFTSQLDYSTFETTLIIHNLTPEDFQREIRCTARNAMGSDSMRIPIGPQSPPDTPIDLTTTNVTQNTISLSWIPGFDGGSDQTFEVRYRREGEGDDVYHGINTTDSRLKLEGLPPARVYSFQVRAINSRGFSSELSRPALLVGTLSEDGVDVIQHQANPPISYKILFGIVAAIILLIFANICHFCKRRSRKFQEKTQAVRTAFNGDGVRPVQMYGTMLQATGGPRCDDMPDASEDDHSVRTMIEVNPNGYLQQIDPTVYDRSCLMDYDYDHRDVSSRHGTLGRPGNGTYTNMPYPEPPLDAYSDRSLARRLLTNNNDNLGHQLSTFIQPNGVRTGPIHYSQLDGDLV